jgi:hypothetical protein
MSASEFPSELHSTKTDTPSDIDVGNVDDGRSRLSLMAGPASSKETASNHFWGSAVSLRHDDFLGKNGGDDGTRTRDLCRDRAAF